MKTTGIRSILIICFFSLCFNVSRASHIAGAEITYNHISGNSYQVNLNLFVDCLGFDPGASQFISAASSCAPTTSLNLNVINPGGTEISQVCSTQINNTACSGGSLPGMWVFKYTGTITLPVSCDGWKLSWSTCCRNNAVVNLVNPSSHSIYVETVINGITAGNNNSPYFTNSRIPYVCAGQSVNYNSGVVETDGDSLHFSLVSAHESASGLIGYTTGYSGTSPIQGILIDPLTGMLSFNPSTLGSFVVVVLVTEFDNSGNVKGSVMRDLQFMVMNCTNTIPDISAGAITNFTGSATQSGPNAISMCGGNNFEFDLVFGDSDSSNILTYQTNISTLLPGAVVTNNGSNPLTVHVSWTAPISLTERMIPLTIDVMDGACPIIGIQSYIYTVTIIGKTYAGPDKIICGSQTAILNVTGGSSFSWSVLSGPPIAVGVNFSCDTCAIVIASPVTTTIYQVVSDLAGCLNTDTITVFVFPGFTFNALTSHSSLCISSDNQFSVTGLSSPSAYSFLWSPATGLNNNTISSPIATASSPGTFQYYVVVSDSNGCVRNDTVQFTVLSAYPPQPVVQASDSTVCAGTAIQLSATFYNAQMMCGTTPSPCISSTIATVGNVMGANTSNTWPTPYGNWYTSQKMQMLFTAAELNAAGITGGKIDQIDFEITAINGISTYHEYTIKMGCTNMTALNAAWAGSLYQVFDPATVNVMVGWNTHVFNNSFIWDGVSNIIVEICSYEGPGVSYTNNSVSPFTTTTFSSCIYSYNDMVNMCPDLTNTVTVSNNRPLVRFHSCNVSVDSSNYIYSWQPVVAVQSPSSQLTNATVNTNTTYTLTVTDTATGCSTTVSENVNLEGQGIYIQGNVQYNSSAVNGYAKLYESIPGVPLIDSVAITSGNYIFSNVSVGNFIIQATADSIAFPDAFPTYYDTVVDWSSATLITMSTCNDTTTANIDLLGQPGMIGTNVLAGTIIEGTGYVHSAGMPLANVNVFLMNSSTGIALEHSVTNPGGVYRFNDVPDGCYKIYVDIPGLPVDSIYNICVSGNDTLTDLHYIADATSVFITNSALSVQESVNSQSAISVFPNPANETAIIAYLVAEKGKIEIQIMDLLGKSIVLMNEVKTEGSYKYLLQPAQMGLSPGIYLINLRTSNENILRKLIITK